MKRSSRLIILIGVFLAILAMVGVIILLAPGQTKPDGGGGEEAIVKVVYAKVDIPQGTVITTDMLTTRDVKKSEQPTDSVSVPQDVIGRTARRSIVKDAPVRLADVQGTAGIIDVARELKAGERAMAIQVDQVAGVGALIQPGDRVDIVVGIQEPQIPVVVVNPFEEESPITGQLTTPEVIVTKVPDELINGTSVKTLIQNVRVVKTLLPPPKTTTTGQAQPQPEEPSLTGDQEIVIVAVTAQQAEVIKYAQLEGSISLALRSPVDRDVTTPDATTGIVLKTLIDEYGVLPGRLVQTVIP
ncbi:MAG: Flp pilus assembly protein CpaB [Chloroflexi bacterium GWC2_73_18]|nr:MAG: Flp pilus assembly protein CpaB [Chloroflexi bacterium GWC2_73_18]